MTEGSVAEREFRSLHVQVFVERWQRHQKSYRFLSRKEWETGERLVPEGKDKVRERIINECKAAN